eukprot:CAMPEP_0118922862 /NCGR_PEP_ID=MMETSP1169-20130426/1629_1 /TAXON_ID=36882 /ORGANISM="Pyramimonas obovata, Strain CCMP722" /LENGTH=376 /DNA_ID=CAMNT_0006863789 /DNA_START=193 /DNA_END=1323 /DNA_ORIENTATION=+
MAPTVKTTHEVKLQQAEISGPKQRSEAPAICTPEEIQASIPALMQMMQGHFVSMSLNALVRLGVPDALGQESLTVAELASRLDNISEEALWRQLRAMAGVGLFKEEAGPNGEAKYSLTALTKLMQTGLPQPSFACGSLHWNEPALWTAWLELPNHMQKGAQPAYNTVVGGEGIFDFYKTSPGSARWFNEFMSTFSAAELLFLPKSYDWGQFGKLVDVGGSLGVTVAAIKKEFPQVTCLNFDLPEVVAAAPPLEGVEYVGGDMFDPATIPADADCIFMKHILHDWSDADSVKVLQSLHQATPAHCKVVLAEAVLPNPGEAHPLGTPAKFIDILMFLIGGKERSKSQWEALVAEAGWVLESVTETPGPNAQLVTCVKA